MESSLKTFFGYKLYNNPRSRGFCIIHNQVDYLELVISESKNK